MSLDARPSEIIPLTSVDELVDTFRRAEKPVAGYRLGLEHEKLLIDTRTWAPVAYEGPHGIRAILERFVAEGYEPFSDKEGGPPIALKHGGLTLSLEPGGQFELSGTAVRTAKEAADENAEHLRALGGFAEALGLMPYSLGYRPFGTTAEMPWMPKQRYGAMRDSLGVRGRYALDMMLMTATCQISLDWSDEADAAQKASVSARVAPALIGLYANSPIVRGAPSGMLSYRSHVWTDVDPARCGTPAFYLDGSFSYRAYVEWALDAPLLFLRRNEQYLRPKLTFRELLRDGFEGEPARDSDWVDHLSTLFPDVRLKSILEIRSADGATGARASALAALYRGLLYDRAALAEADRLFPRWTVPEHQAWMAAATKDGLRAREGKDALLPMAKTLVELARDGLRRVAPDEVSLLAPLEEVLAEGRSPAERVLEAWEKHRTPEAVYRASGV